MVKRLQILAALALLTASPAQGELPTYTCVKTAAAAMVDVSDLSGRRQHAHPTQVRMLWDEEQLYVLFIATAPDAWSTLADRDDRLWNEEVVEFYADPDGDGANCVEIEVNPLGAVLDLHCPDEREEQHWRPQAQWHAEGMRWAVRGMRSPEVRADEAWMVELSVPWAAMPEVTREPFEGAESLRVNLCRCQMRPDGTGELTSWTAATKRFSELDVMGRLLLVE